MNTPRLIHPGRMLMGKLADLITAFDSRSGTKATRIKLGENQMRTFREEARLHTATDFIREDMFMGCRIIPARHPDDIIIDAEEGEE